MAIGPEEFSNGLYIIIDINERCPAALFTQMSKVALLTSIPAIV
jgi:hypothetical protein